MSEHDDTQEQGYFITQCSVTGCMAGVLVPHGDPAPPLCAAHQSSATQVTFLHMMIGKLTTQRDGLAEVLRTLMNLGVIPDELEERIEQLLDICSR